MNKLQELSSTEAGNLPEPIPFADAPEPLATAEEVASESAKAVYVGGSVPVDASTESDVTNLQREATLAGLHNEREASLQEATPENVPLISERMTKSKKLQEFIEADFVDHKYMLNLMTAAKMNNESSEPLPLNAFDREFKNQQYIDAGTMLAEKAVAGQLQKETYRLVGDFAELLVPTHFSSSIAEQSKLVFNDGKDSPFDMFVGAVFAGKSLHDMSIRLSEMSGEERFNVINNYIKKLERNDTNIIGTGGNALLNVDILYSIVHADNPSEIHRYLYNALGILDMMPAIINIFKAGTTLTKGIVTGFVQGAARGAQYLPGSLKSLGKVFGDPLATFSRTTDERALRAIGSSPEAEVNETLHARPMSDTLSEARAMYPNKAKEIDKIEQNVQVAREDQGNISLAVFEAEKEATARKVINIIKGIPDVEVTNIRIGDRRLVGTDSKILNDADLGEQTFRLRATIAPEGAGSVGSIEEAKDIVASLGNFGRFARIEGKNAKGELTHKLDDVVDDKYTVAIDLTHKYNPLKDVDSALVFGEQGFFRPGWLNGSGTVTGYLVDNGNRLLKNFLSAVNVASDTKLVLQRHLSDVAQPFNKLGNTSKHRVAEVITKMAEREEAHSLSAVVDEFGLTAEEAVGYAAFRETVETIYSVANTTLRNSLINQGMKHVVGKGGLSLLAKEISPKNYKKVPDNVWNTLIKGEVKMSDDDIANALETGALSVVKVRGGIIHGNKKYNYALVDGKTTRIEELPQYVLKHKANWDGGRYYRETYFVDMAKTMRVDGELQKAMVAGKMNPNADIRAIAAFPSEREAKEFIEAQKILHPKHEFRVRLDNKRDLGSEGHMQVIEAQGRMFSSHRGDRLLGTDDGLARVEDVVTSLHRSINAVAHHKSFNEVIDGMITRFKQHYADQLHKTNGAVDFNKGLIKDATAEAREAYDLIAFYRGIRTPGELSAKRGLLKFADWMEGKGPSGESFANYLRRVNLSPSSALLSTTFALYIAANPMKQLMLQGLQWSMIAGISPKIMAKSLVEAQGLLLGMAFRHNDKVLRAIAKVTGRELKEQKALVKAYINSGLPYSMNKNMYLQRQMAFMTNRDMTNSLWARAQQGAGNIGAAPIRYLQRVGFNAGEQENLAITFQFALNKWIKNNPGKDWTKDKLLWSKLGAEARAMALNANHAGTSKLQRGVFATATQFWSFQIKAWMAILTKSQVFTRAEQKRMALGMFALYGMSGGGRLTKAGGDFTSAAIGSFAPLSAEEMSDGFWRKIEDELGTTISDTARTVINTGVAGWGLNTMLTNIYGLDADGRGTHLDVGGTIAPTAGLGIMGVLLETDAKLWDVMFGVSGSSVPALINLGVELFDIFYAQPVVGKDSDATWRAVYNSFERTIPVLDNFRRYRDMIAHNVGREYSKHGQDLGARTTSEGYAMLFGMPSSKRIAAYELNLQNKEHRTKLNLLAKDLASFTRNALNRNRKNKPQAIREALRHRQYLLTGMSHEDKEYLKSVYFKALSDDYSRNSRDSIVSMYRDTLIPVSTSTDLKKHLQFQISKDVLLSVDDRKMILNYINQLLPEEDNSTEKLIERLHTEGEINGD